jgi:heme-degrading monooxygenase HmoA
MFSVIFEVYPKSDQWETYLGLAKMLRPELEQIEGFIDNIRYGSLRRNGWILSLSSWKDEKELVRWRTKQHHHETQEKGRNEVLADYHLRVGQLTKDTKPPTGYQLYEQRLDVTETGEGTMVTLINGHRPPEWIKDAGPNRAAKVIGLNEGARGLVAWDVFDSILTPGDVILLLSWQDQDAAETFEKNFSLTEGGRLRRVRVVRDYGMFDRREAPQYYPEVQRPSR